MPTYVYRFVDTEGTIEVQQSFKDDPLTEAINPADGKLHPVKKVFMPVGVSFKGGGFYKTDSRGGSSSSSTSSTTATAGSSSTSESSGSSASNGSTGSTESSSSTTKPATPAPSAPSSTSSSD